MENIISKQLPKTNNLNKPRYKLSILIDCSHCAQVIEGKIAKLPDVAYVSVSAVTKQLILELTKESAYATVLQQARNIAEEVEPGTSILELSTSKNQYLYYIDINCAHCASLIEEAINKLPEVKDATITMTTKQLRFTLNPEANLDLVLAKMREIAQNLEPGTTITKQRNQQQTKTSLFNRLHAKFHNWELIIGASLFLIAEFTDLLPKDSLTTTYIVAYIFLGIHVILNSLNNIRRGRIFDENFLMTIATMGAFIIGEHPEAVGVMLFFRIGEAFEAYATNRSRQEIISAVDLRPETVHRLQADGTTLTIPAEDVEIGDIIIVKPGERIPVDGMVIEGASRIDTSPITGESLPIKVVVNKEVLSGCINLNSTLRLRVTKDLNNSMVTRILDSVENAAANKPVIQRFITRFANIYTPFVVAIAAITAIVPSILTGNWEYWIYTALTFLVISCPCALVLSVPLAFFSGIGMASKYGILFKGGNSIEGLTKIKAVAFDKTGTLTKGTFSIQSIDPVAPFTETELLQFSASCEEHSNHPIATSISNYIQGQNLNYTKLDSCQEISGEGIQGQLGSKTILCGNARLMERHHITIPNSHSNSTDTVVHLAVNDQYIGSITIGDQIKDDATTAINTLQKWGITTAIFTGDNIPAAEKVANKLGIKKVFAKLLPQDKLARLAELRQANGAVLFVGDGINDAPILAGADVSAAMGSGADAALEAADMVFMNSKLQAVVNAFSIAKNTLSLAWQNILLALGIKAIIMVLGLMGHASMWAAVFADSGVALLCVLNSLRLFSKKYPQS